MVQSAWGTFMTTKKYSYYGMVNLAIACAWHLLLLTSLFLFLLTNVLIVILNALNLNEASSSKNVTET